MWSNYTALMESTFLTQAIYCIIVFRQGFASCNQWGKFFFFLPETVSVPPCCINAQTSTRHKRSLQVDSPLRVSLQNLLACFHSGSDSFSGDACEVKVAAPSHCPSAEAEYWRIKAMAQQVSVPREDRG